MTITRRAFVAGLLTACAVALHTAPASAESLMERARSGKPIRLGFSNEVPWAYPGENNKPLGFANAHALGVLAKMGFTNIEPVVTEWGSLIPGLNAGRFDIITGGMYITPKRCKNAAFAEPMGEFGDAFIVAKGNPKGIETFKDILADESAVLVTGAGYITVDLARKVG
ncbi:MAG: transporter substrate-binding domain-containing protein, partial [Burkholderiales bacterium]